MNEGRIEQVGSPDEVYDRPASPFVLKFLGDVNLAPEGGEVGYVRPHELDLVGQPGPDTWSATFSQALTVGAHTRLECLRDDGVYVDVELPREHWHQLRQQHALQAGSRVHLRPRRVARFEQAA